MKAKEFDIIVIGGGAAGFFAAINAANFHPKASIAILEHTSKLLTKVKISGGGRCNVTHACWTPKELIAHYPRGSKELLGPFHKFCTGDTQEWFERRGVDLKIEEDGRMFPSSNSSQTIIDCFEREINHFGIKVLTEHKVLKLNQIEKKWHVHCENQLVIAQSVLIATGSSLGMWKVLSKMKHTIVPPVPSLFTFNCKDKRLLELQGLSVPQASVKVNGTKLKSKGPLLITHWGLSGPAVLKLSAWGAIALHQLAYKFSITVNFTKLDLDIFLENLEELKSLYPDKKVASSPQENIPKRLWNSLISKYAHRTWHSLQSKELQNIARMICQAEFDINGKSTFKDEFVTAGGVELKEVDFRTMESKIYPNLFFAGEVLNIDAITGGFNFQAAWTTSYIASQHFLK